MLLAVLGVAGMALLPHLSLHPFQCPAGMPELWEVMGSMQGKRTSPQLAVSVPSHSFWVGNHLWLTLSQRAGHVLRHCLLSAEPGGLPEREGR